jgi:hypothetical protein
MKVLCYHCHINWWHKNIIEASDWFKKRFPERYKYLFIDHKDNTKNWKVWELEELITKLDNELEYLTKYK